MDKNSKLSYILAIVIPAVGLLWSMISDIFTIAKSTLYYQVLYRIMADLLISWSLIILLIIFLIYLFLEGLQFTENKYLIDLSKNSNKFYTLGFELSFVVIPIALFLLIIFYLNNVYFTYLLIGLITIYLFTNVRRLSENLIKYYKLLFMGAILFILTFLPFFGIFQLVTTDVSINFDRTYYRADDYVIITIDQSGISYPQINEISINKNVVSKENQTELFTSDKGIKKIIIHKVDHPDFGKSNYNNNEVDVNYSIDFLFWRGLVNNNKFASFIVVK